MKFGLSDNVIVSIQKVFEEEPKIDTVMLFGSRAKGNFKPGSDIDLAVKGKKIDFDIIRSLSVKLDDLDLPYKIDLINYNSINDKDVIDHIYRVGIVFYRRWKQFKFGDIAELKYGKAHQSLADGNIPAYGSGGLMRFVDRALYDDESILIPRKGTLNNIVYMNEPFWTVDTMFWTKLNKEMVLPKFLFYKLTTFDFANMNVGSAVPSMTVPVLNDIDISLPPLPEQTAIAEILSSLDNKIDLLHRQNKTLEQLAETLFRQWFVVGAEEKFKMKPLGDFVDSTLGGEWGKENPEGEYQLEVQCIRGTDIADLEKGIPERTPIRFIKQKKFENIEIQSGDLVMEISGGTDDQSTGRTMYINDDIKALFKHPLIFSNFCRLIRPKKKEYSFFLYSYIHHLYQQGDLFNLENGSSGIKNLDYKSLLFQLEYRLPETKDVLNYNKEVEAYFLKINKNKQQIIALSKLWDTLLPKLMSGELRVKN